jgi:predicted PurR-regulated permease PerM
MLINLAAFVVVVAGIILAKSIIIPFLLASFLAIICAPPLYWLRTKGVPSLVSILLLVLIVMALETALAGLISSSMADFSTSLPLYQERLTVIIKHLIHWAAGHGVEVTEKIVMDQFDPGKLMRLAASMLNNLFSVLTNTFMIMLTFAFILLEATGFPDKLRAMSGTADTSLQEYGKIIKGVNRYLGLKVLTSLVTGIIISIGLLVIKVDFAIMWGVVAFMLNFIPTIGSIIAAVPPMLLALVQIGPAASLTVAVLYLATNISIGSILEPRIMGSGVGLSALVIFVSMIFWGWVLGPVGMLLSVPLTMTLKIALAGNKKTSHIALLLGSNSEASAALRLPASNNSDKQEPT